MPLPLFVGGIAAVAGLAGVKSGIEGGVKAKEASDVLKAAKTKQEWAVSKFESSNTYTTTIMDDLGKKELEILATFDDFSNIISKIQGRPSFKEYSREGINISEYKAEELMKVSAGADILIGGIGGAAAGTAGGFAAAGATTSAVMALGTASTGTAISSLSGVAATNATLAALGGGSIAAGGGGMALGSAVLGGATLGIGLLVGGKILKATGQKLSEKADEAYMQAERTEREVGKVCRYLYDLGNTADMYLAVLEKVEKQYLKRLTILDNIVHFYEKTEWSDFIDKEKIVTENTVLLVGLLYKMCKVNLVIKTDRDDGTNDVNSDEAEMLRNEADAILQGMNSFA